MASDARQVLVVDDEEVLRSLLTDMLEACGYEAHVAEGGAAALALFRERRYETVITDLLMPGMNGLELAAALRAIDPEVQVILLTGSAPSLTVNHARAAGVTMLLHKPIALNELKSAVDSACAAGCQ